MCDPMTIAGIAASAGSMVLQNVAAGKVEKARKGAMEAERIRQGALDQQAAAINDQSQGRYSDFQGDQAQKAEDLSSFFQSQNQALPAQNLPTETVPVSSNIVVQEQAKQAGKAKAYSDQQATALGNLRAFGDVLGDKSRLQGRDASLIGQIGGFKAGSQNVLPAELEAANNKGSSLRLFGDVLGLAGTAATGYGLGKGGYNLFGSGATKLSTPLQTNKLTSSLLSGVGSFNGVRAF